MLTIVMEKLLATDGQDLIERASWDSFWGDGGNGTGLNWTGRLIKERREDLIIKQLGRELTQAIKEHST